MGEENKLGNFVTFGRHRQKSAPLRVAARRRKFDKMARMNPALEIHAIVSMPFEENTYIVWLPTHREALVIDPGLEPDLILAFLDERDLSVAAILNTHGHADHIGGNEALKNRYPEAPLLIGVNETSLLTDANLNLSAPFGLPIVSPTADRTVQEERNARGGGADARGVRDSGAFAGARRLSHSRGAEYCLRRRRALCRQHRAHRFSGGSLKRLEDGIRKKLYTLPDDTIVYPGHGRATTIGAEKKNNPFVRCDSLQNNRSSPQVKYSEPAG